MTWHSVTDAAPKLGLSEEIVYRLCKTRRLAHRRVGERPGAGKIQISDEGIAAFLAACEVPVSSPNEKATQTKGGKRKPRAPLGGEKLAADGQPAKYF